MDNNFKKNDNQLAKSLLTTCNRLVVNKLPRDMRTHSDFGFNKCFNLFLIFPASFRSLCVEEQQLGKHVCVESGRCYDCPQRNRRGQKQIHDRPSFETNICVKKTTALVPLSANTITKILILVYSYGGYVIKIIV